METCRAGDVIPKIGNVDLSQRPEEDVPFTFPAHCPECSSDLALDGPTPRCTGGLGCAAQVRKRLQHLVSREALNIDGVSPARIDVFWDSAALPIRTPVDIFARRERETDGVLASSPATASSMRRTTEFNNSHIAPGSASPRPPSLPDHAAFGLRYPLHTNGRTSPKISLTPKDPHLYLAKKEYLKACDPV